jgi:hypothetical protein
MICFNLRSRILAAALTIIVQSAHAQQPPDSVASDAYLNTASGTGALQNILPASGGQQSTAFGYSALLSDTTGYRNTAMGTFALTANTTGYGNAAFGYESLYTNTTGLHNTGTGSFTLHSNTSGNSNVAFGIYALFSNTTGTNTALGYAALYFNTTGNNNDATGYQALYNNTTGNYNTASGDFSLEDNTTGSSNTASGFQALLTNSTGANNTAFGANALYWNTVGRGNAAQGANALFNNTTGIRNLGIGNNALLNNSTGSYNIGLGFNAASNVTTGSYNIEIGAPGTASDDNTIQIGVQGTQTSTTIAGIFGTTLTGSAVYVTATGQLGVLASSERYKTEVATMGVASARLLELRPVTFKLKNDAKGRLQYGLIAEEVAQVYPELVIRGADGRIDGVRYEELTPMLLNLVQQQQATMRTQGDKQAADALRMEEQASQVRALKERLIAQGAELKSTQRQVAELNDLKHELQVVLLSLKAKHVQLAQR